MTFKQIANEWSPENVRLQNYYQIVGVFHPYTCGGKNKLGQDCRTNLVATKNGWVCPAGCGYMQDWSHGSLNEEMLYNHPYSPQIASYNSDDLLKFAEKICIDPLSESYLEKRSNSTWAVVQGGQCLGRDLTWAEEHIPSQREELYLKVYRFDSVKEAIDLFLLWRNQNYFVGYKESSRKEWKCILYSPEKQPALDFWEGIANEKTTTGRLILVGRDREIIKDFVGPKGSGFKFIDFPYSVEK
jgi:hypothetical protein